MILYLIAFLDGLLTFISPCLLPMLPLYLSYIGGQDVKSYKLFLNACAFVLGFGLVFTALGAFAGFFGSFFIEYKTLLQILTGAFIVFLGLVYLGLIPLPLALFQRNTDFKPQPGFFFSFLFGVMISISWTPCVSAFLGSVLALAAGSGNTLQGILLLSVYSLGLGVPFLICALIIQHLKSSLDWIKRNYKAVHAISGGLLVILGLLVMTGGMDYLLNLLSF